MANLLVKDPPTFTDEIHQIEREEYITAELENEIKEALLNNDVFLKVLAEAIRKKSNEHIEDGTIHVTTEEKKNWSDKAGTAVATPTAAGLESAEDKRKLDGVADGAEVNQNAFSNIKVGTVTVIANGKTAMVTLEAGSNVTISADNASKKIVIAANKDGGNADMVDGYHAAHFAVADHGHDGKYYTKDESNGLLNQKAASNHSHNGVYLPYLSGLTSGYVRTGQKVGTTVGEGATAEGENTTASGNKSHAEGKETNAYGNFGHAEGLRTTADYAAHAEGFNTTASGLNSHAEGSNTTASGANSHAEGCDNIASGGGTHAEGGNNTVSGTYAHVEGWYCTASGQSSHAEGEATIASGRGSHAGGYYTIASSLHSTVIGRYNVDTDRNFFAIGNGSNEGRTNAFSVGLSGTVKAASTITASTAADYAEFFEWLDRNPEKEDRVGHFVTLEGTKIRYANSQDDYILGIISGQPFVLGNGDCDTWNGMYLRDEFNRIIQEPAPKIEMEDITEEVDREVSELDKETGKMITKVVKETMITGSIEKEVFDEKGDPVYEGTRAKLNPNYKPNEKYISRFERPEWDAVGMLGVLSVYDDGTCEVNGYAKCSDSSIATKAESGYRVIERVTENIVKVVFR